MTKRMAYSEIFEIFKASWESIKGIKGALWVGFLMVVATGLPGGIAAGLQAPVFVSAPMTAIGHIVSLLIYVGIVAIIKKWQEAKEKDFDDLFAYVLDWGKIKPILYLLIFGGILSAISMLLSPENPAKPIWWKISLQMLISLLITLNYFVVFMVSFQNESIMTAWKRVFIGMLKNLDILIVSAVIISISFGIGAVATLLIGLIFIIPMIFVVYFEYYKRIFES